MNIGDFALAKDGGWIGIIHTLTLHAKIRLVPTGRTKENTPNYRIMYGSLKIGDAWEGNAFGDTSKRIIRMCFDDPLFSRPLKAALFPSETGNVAQLVWNRRWARHAIT